MAQLRVVNPELTRMLAMTPAVLEEQARRKAVADAERPKLSLLGIGGLAAAAAAIWLVWGRARRRG